MYHIKKKMGANVSTTEIVNEVINKNKSKIVCEQADESYQVVNANFGNLDLSGNCKISTENRVTMKSNCDLSSIQKALSEQEAMSKLEQTAAAGLAVNSNSTKQENITKNINDLFAKCSSKQKSLQEIKKNYGNVKCTDNASLVNRNTGMMEADCLLAAAAELDSKQKAETETSQTVEGLLDGLFAALFGPLGIIIAIIAAIILLPMLGTFKTGKKNNYFPSKGFPPIPPKGYPPLPSKGFPPIPGYPS